MLIKGSFDDYIYILVGLIWLGFSIYKGVQKKKAASSPVTDAEDGNPPEKKKSIFDDFLNQILQEEEPVPYQPVDEEIPIEKEPVVAENITENRQFSYDDNYEESNYLAQTDVYQKESAARSTLETQIETPPKKQLKKPRFNLRKAVIYSEILNTRYF